MALDADVLMDRIQLKQKLKKWQVISFCLLALAFFALIAPYAGKNGPVVGKPYIARVSLEGMLLDDTYRDSVLSDLVDDKEAKAVIVSIDSPGGTTAAGESLYSQLRDISNSGKPVVAVMKTLAASGGYMTALGADYIVARRGTITGSIGVLMESPEFTELADKVGVTFNVIKSAELKASPSPFEKMTPKSQAAMQAVIDDFYKYFVDLTAERRNLDRDKALELADGRVYTGNQAVENGLIDAIGGEKEAIEWLEKEKKIEAGLDIEDISTIEPDKGLLSDLFGDMKKSQIYQKLNLQGMLAVWYPNN